MTVPVLHEPEPEGVKMDRFYELASQSAVLAALVVPTVEGIRKRIPAVDGWIVVLLSALISGLLAVLLLRPSGVQGAYDSSTVAVLSLAIAIGGDAWIQKVMGSIGQRS